jgi:hypothetical protein
MPSVDVLEVEAEPDEVIEGEIVAIFDEKEYDAIIALQGIKLLMTRKYNCFIVNDIRRNIIVVLRFEYDKVSFSTSMIQFRSLQIFSTQHP